MAFRDLAKTNTHLNYNLFHHYIAKYCAKELMRKNLKPVCRFEWFQLQLATAIFGGHKHAWFITKMTLKLT